MFCSSCSRQPPAHSLRIAKSSCARMPKGAKRLIKTKTKAKQQKGDNGAGTNRQLTNQALGEVIAKKQHIDTIKKVNEILKAKTHLACRVLHVLESGMFESSEYADVIPQSTNKFRLLSLNHCKEILLAMVPATAMTKFAEDLALVRVKREAMQLLCFIVRCTEGCALPSRSIPRLHHNVKARAEQVPGRWARFEIVSNTKSGKAGGNIVKYPRGVFEFTDYCEEGLKYTKVMHIDSGIKVDIWDEIVVKKGTAIQDNWNEFSAFVKIRAEVFVMQMFESATEGDKDSSGQYHGVPAPLDDDVIPERRSSTEAATPRVAATAAESQTAEPERSKRRLKKNLSAASDCSHLPPGWGGSMGEAAK
jgi:hypothetical protein